MRLIARTCVLLTAVAACKSSGRAPGDGGTDAHAGAIAQKVACRDDSECGGNAYCEYTPGLCGKGKRPGACRSKPAACAEAYSPVCGCDGKIYGNECSAHAAGIDLAVGGGCRESVPDHAACGRRYCDVRTSYCEIFLSDVPELPTDYFCRPLPASCMPADGAARTCDCFPAGTRCSSFCGPLFTTPGGMTGFHLTCQGTRPPPE